MTPRLLVLFAGLFIAPDGLENEDAKKMQGSWIAVGLEHDGIVEDATTKRAAYHFLADKFVFLIGDDEQRITFRLDPSKSPKQFTLGDKGKPTLGIYEFKDDKLRICLPTKGDGKSPTEFTGGRGSMLLTLRRAKEGEIPAKPAKQ